MPGRRRDEPVDPLRSIGCTDAVPIGSGGSSVVYRARQEAFDRLIAVKVLTTPVIDEPARRRFRRELTMAGRLTGHPNVVSVFASGFLPDGRGYVQMEYCPGGSLADRLAAEGVLPVEDVISIGVKICGVLELAAREGIVHRDVKPANILVTRFGEPALSDFGIAVLAGERTGTTNALTPAHAAPEVLESHQVGPSADQWSLASTLHTLLAGRAPFAVRNGEGMLAGLLRVLSDPVPVIPRADMPDGLHKVLERAMAKSPSDRWPSAGEFGRALQSVERHAGRPVTRMPIEEVHETPVVRDAGTNSGPGTRSSEEMTTPGLRDRLRSAGDRPPPVARSTGPASSSGLADRPGRGDRPRLAGPSSFPDQPDDRTRRWSWHRPPAAPDVDPTGPPPGRRPWVWVAAGGLIVVGIVLAVVMTTGSPAHRIAGRQPPHLQTPSATLATTLAPRQVQVINEQPTSVTIQWVDPSNGQYPFVVRVSNGVIQTAASHTQAVVTGLDPAKGYCFVVGAVYGVGGQVANAAPVCVRGGTM